MKVIVFTFLELTRYVEICKLDMKNNPVIDSTILPSLLLSEVCDKFCNGSCDDISVMSKTSVIEGR